MSQLSSASIDKVVEACRRNCESIVESFNRCFGTRLSMRIGEPEKWGTRPELHQQSGLLVTFGIGECGLAVAIPATIPLPDWHANPGDTEQARLDTLPMEWSVSVLPEEFAVDQFGYRKVEDLSEAVVSLVPTTDAIVLPLLLDPNPAEASEGATPGASLLLIGPVTKPEFGTNSADFAAMPAEESGAFREQAPFRSAHDDRTRLEQARRTRQILKLKVPVIVKLAEKRIQLGQLLALGPGAIVTFEKSCEDLLDLCVNNQVYCRGEAVKIGEKFGLKVNEITPPQIARDPIEN